MVSNAEPEPVFVCGNASNQADLLDQLSIIDVIKETAPDEVYNLAAMSFVPTSWKQPVLTGEFTAIGASDAASSSWRSAADQFAVCCVGGIGSAGWQV